MTCDIDSGSVNSIADLIDAAEEIRDPLDAIIERVPDDPGAAFTPEALKTLAA